MDSKTLEDALLPWLRVSTWHTKHFKDDERFHQAIHVAFGQLGSSISPEDFEQAIKNVLYERHPGQEKSMSDSIEHFVRRAEVIGSYLLDVRNLR